MARKTDAEFKKYPTLDEHELDESSYDASFVLDPSKIFDELPQPFRLVDKTVNYIFDRAWEAIQELELRASELGLGGKLPVFNCANELPELSQSTLMCCSLDGKFAFAVAKIGIIYVLDTETSCVVAVNDELQGLKVEKISTGRLNEDKHFVCLLLENGTAAIFALSGGNLHLLRVFNEDFGAKGSETTFIRISYDGAYLAVGWKIPQKSSWLEIYKVPKEYWMNELKIIDEKITKKLDEEENVKGDEETQKDGNDSVEKDLSDSEDESGVSRPTSLGQSGTQTGYLNETLFTKPTLILRIKGPTDPTPNPAGSVTSALKNFELDNDVIGTGTNHVLLQPYFDESNRVFEERHEQYLQYLGKKDEDNSTLRLPNVHFLTPGRFVPVGMQTTPDQVNSVIVYWSETQHGLIYSLVKSSKDVERKPDVVLTMFSKILVSDVSVCKSFISFATENNNIVTWDKLTGLPLTVVNLPMHNNTITSLHFIPTIIGNGCTSLYPKLLVCSGNGGLCMVEYGDDGQTTIVDLPPSSLKIKDPVVQVTSLQNLPQLMLVQRSSGKIMLLDVASRTLKCQIGLAKPLTMLDGFCFTHGTSTLYMIGGRKDEYNEYILPESVSVYKMNLDTFPVVKTYMENPTVKVKTGRVLESLNERIAFIEEQRNSSYEKRQRKHKTRWRQLEGELNRMKRPVNLGESLWFTETLTA
ncbi:WD repeat-containing protein 93-like [Dendronephthya gigantea]|uniref:WD repeat-containing protein 93-like n=1 Tax=Dendronephthya gigantea TaxID=151771 RepID=UPI00106B3A42|nr:WD repeat-containing protein 93-like [Dendronephthya gigantea]